MARDDIGDVSRDQNVTHGRSLGFILDKRKLPEGFELRG